MKNFYFIMIALFLFVDPSFAGKNGKNKKNKENKTKSYINETGDIDRKKYLEADQTDGTSIYERRSNYRNDQAITNYVIEKNSKVESTSPCNPLTDSQGCRFADLFILNHQKDGKQHTKIQSYGRDSLFCSSDNESCPGKKILQNLAVENSEIEDYKAQLRELHRKQKTKDWFIKQKNLESRLSTYNFSLQKLGNFKIDNGAVNLKKHFEATNQTCNFEKSQLVKDLDVVLKNKEVDQNIFLNKRNARNTCPGVLKYVEGKRISNSGDAKKRDDLVSTEEIAELFLKDQEQIGLDVIKQTFINQPENYCSDFMVNTMKMVNPTEYAYEFFRTKQMHPNDPKAQEDTFVDNMYAMLKTQVVFSDDNWKDQFLKNKLKEHFRELQMDLPRTVGAFVNTDDAEDLHRWGSLNKLLKNNEKLDQKQFDQIINQLRNENWSNGTMKAQQELSAAVAIEELSAIKKECEELKGKHFEALLCSPDEELDLLDVNYLSDLDPSLKGCLAPGNEDINFDQFVYSETIQYMTTDSKGVDCKNKDANLEDCLNGVKNKEIVSNLPCLYLMNIQCSQKSSSPSATLDSKYLESIRLENKEYEKKWTEKEAELLKNDEINNRNFSSTRNADFSTPKGNLDAWVNNCSEKLKADNAGFKSCADFANGISDPFSNSMRSLNNCYTAKIYQMGRESNSLGNVEDFYNSFLNKKLIEFGVTADQVASVDDNYNYPTNNSSEEQEEDFEEEDGSLHGSRFVMFPNKPSDSVQNNSAIQNAGTKATDEDKTNFLEKLNIKNNQTQAIQNSINEKKFQIQNEQKVVEKLKKQPQTPEVSKEIDSRQKRIDRLKEETQALEEKLADLKTKKDKDSYQTLMDEIKGLKQQNEEMNKKLNQGQNSIVSQANSNTAPSNTGNSVVSSTTSFANGSNSKVLEDQHLTPTPVAGNNGKGNSNSNLNSDFDFGGASIGRNSKDVLQVSKVEGTSQTSGFRLISEGDKVASTIPVVESVPLATIQNIKSGKINDDILKEIMKACEASVKNKAQCESSNEVVLIYKVNDKEEKMLVDLSKIKDSKKIRKIASEPKEDNKGLKKERKQKYFVEELNNIIGGSSNKK